MGWIDSEMVADETMIEEDIMTLPSEISEALSSEEYFDCMNKMQDDAMGFHNKYVLAENVFNLTFLISGVWIVTVKMNNQSCLRCSEVLPTQSASKACLRKAVETT